MKRYSWLVLVVSGLVLCLTASAQATIWFSDNFNTGTLDTSKWGVYWHGSVGPDPYNLAGVKVENTALHITGNGGFKPAGYTKIPTGLPQNYIMEFDYMRPLAESTQGYAMNIFGGVPSPDGIHSAGGAAGGAHYTRIWSTTSYNARKFEAAGSSTAFAMEFDTWYSIRATVANDTSSTPPLGFTTWEVFTQGFGSLVTSMTFPTFTANTGAHDDNIGGVYFEAHIDDWATQAPTGGFYIDNMFIGDQPNMIPEPSTLLILGAGLAGLGGCVRRRIRS
jgi:hypothetical protein